MMSRGKEDSLGKAGDPCLRMQQENDEVCDCGLKVKQVAFQTCSQGLEVEGLEEIMNCLHRWGRWGKRKWQGKGCLLWKNMWKQQLRKQVMGLEKASKQCDNEVQKTCLCSSMWKAVSVTCHAQRECIEGSGLFLQGRKAESCVLTVLCSQQLTSNHSLITDSSVITST